MKLSKRLGMIASFVPGGSRVADIGTDHGYIPIHLVQEGIAKSAIAMDVREGPLLRAQTHIKEAGLTDLCCYCWHGRRTDYTYIGGGTAFMGQYLILGPVTSFGAL